jgi:uncharacterized protein YehS (DUF1456 family)
MYHRKQHHQEASAARSAVVQRTDGAGGNDNTVVSVLTRSEVLVTVNLLEEYIQISSDEKSTDLAGTLIVRLLDRLQTVDRPDPAAQT